MVTEGNNTSIEKSSHKLYLDILRIIGTFLVLFNHTPGYHLYQKPHQPLLTWLYMIVSMFTRVNWPIFFLISGALLLPNTKKESLQQTYRKRLLRFAVVLICFQLFVFYFHHKEISLQSIPLFFQALLSGKYKGAYASTWYLYAYLGFLFMLPYLRKIAKGFNKTDFRVLIILYFLIKTLFPIYRAVWMWTGHEKYALSTDFEIPIMTCRAVFLPLIGYYLDQILDIGTISRKKYLLLTAATAVGILISCTFCYYQGTRTEAGFTTDFNSLFYYLTTIWLFVSIKRIWANKFIPKRSEGGVDQNNSFLQFPYLRYLFI